MIVMRLPDHMVDDDGLRWHQQRMQPLWNLRELHSLCLKDLQYVKEFQPRRWSPERQQCSLSRLLMCQVFNLFHV